MTNEDLVFRGAEHSLSEISPPLDFSIAAAGKLIVTFYPDGRITLGDHLKPDEAAREFLRVLAEAFPAWVAALRGYAESRKTSKIERPSLWLSHLKEHGSDCYACYVERLEKEVDRLRLRVEPSAHRSGLCTECGNDSAVLCSQCATATDNP